MLKFYTDSHPRMQLSYFNDLQVLEQYESFFGSTNFRVRVGGVEFIFVNAQVLDGKQQLLIYSRPGLPFCGVAGLRWKCKSPSPSATSRTAALAQLCPLGIVASQAAIKNTYE